MQDGWDSCPCILIRILISCLCTFFLSRNTDTLYQTKKKTREDGVHRRHVTLRSGTHLKEDPGMFD
jgi:hypothetical protein